MRQSSVTLVFWCVKAVETASAEATVAAAAAALAAALRNSSSRNSGGGNIRGRKVLGMTRNAGELCESKF